MRRTLLVSALLAVIGCGLAGCGASGAPDGSGGAAVRPAAPSGTLSIGVTYGRLGDAVTDTSGGRLRRLSPGSPIDSAARPAPRAREGVGAGATCAHTDVQPDGSNLAGVAEATLCLLNGERADRGLAPLRADRDLLRAALAHAGDMVEHGYFAHSGRNGSRAADRIRAAGYLAGGGEWRIGENLAWGTGELGSPRAIVTAWMGSSGHRANILRTDYREVGVGVVAGNPASGNGAGATFASEFGVVRRPAGSSLQASTRAQARRTRARRARARRSSARRARARAALSPRSSHAGVIGSVSSASRRTGLARG